MIGVHSRRKTGAKAVSTGSEQCNFPALCRRGQWEFGTPEYYVEVRTRRG